MASASLRWWKEQVPVTRRGEILPRSGMYFFRMSTDLWSMNLTFRWQNRQNFFLGGKNFL